MWCLGRFLPLLIGHFIPEGDSFWENFLLHHGLCIFASYNCWQGWLCSNACGRLFDGLQRSISREAPHSQNALHDTSTLMDEMVRFICVHTAPIHMSVNLGVVLWAECGVCAIKRSIVTSSTWPVYLAISRTLLKHLQVITSCTCATRCLNHHSTWEQNRNTLEV